MRNIQNGIAAVITKEKFFNHRVVVGALIILASALVSYLAMAAYVPSMVHAQESRHGEERHDSRSVIASDRQASRDKTDDKSQSHDSSSSQEDSEESSEQSSNSGDTARAQGASSSDEQTTGSSVDATPSIVSPIEAPREVIADERVEREVRRENSRPSPVVASQFSANGCNKRGTSVLRHHSKEVQWNNYGEYGQNTRGECVKSLQRKLNQYCKNKLNVDGQYGPRTANAVRSYQHHMRSLGGITINGSAIHVDGIAGAQTFALMQEFGTSKSFLAC